MGEKKSTAEIDKGIATAVELGEKGLQLTVYVGEELVVNTWTDGFANTRNGRAYDDTTLYPMFSVGKSITALCLHIQAERGYVDYNAPVATYWPEFGCNGKENLTVRHLLTHQSGIPQMPFGVTPELMADWDWMVERLAQAIPIFTPGQGSAYQGMNFGWLVGEVVRRTDPKKRSLADFMREELAEPLDAPDIYFGVPESEWDRIAELESVLYEGPVPNEIWPSRQAKPFNVQPQASVHNNPVFWGAPIPGSGLIANPASVAKVYAMLANGGTFNGVRLLSEERVWGFTQPRPNPYYIDQVVAGGNKSVMNIGMGGFHLRDQAFGGGFSFLCHSGQGRAHAFAHLNTGLAGCIGHNRLFEPYENMFDAYRDIAPAVLALAPGSEGPGNPGGRLGEMEDRLRGAQDGTPRAIDTGVA